MHGHKLLTYYTASRHYNAVLLVGHYLL